MTEQVAVLEDAAIRRADSSSTYDRVLVYSSGVLIAIRNGITEVVPESAYQKVVSDEATVYE